MDNGKVVLLNVSCRLTYANFRTWLSPTNLTHAAADRTNALATLSPCHNLDEG